MLYDSYKRQQCKSPCPLVCLSLVLKIQIMEDKKIIINVGRQLGSGGLVIAKMLAKDFGCNFYDKELLNLAAKESGFSEKFFEQNDEKKGHEKS